MAKQTGTGATSPADSSGAISSYEIYTLDEIDRRLGLGKTALRTARRRGLQVRRIGRKAFVLGRDLIDYLDQHAK